MEKLVSMIKLGIAPKSLHRKKNQHLNWVPWPYRPQLRKIREIKMARRRMYWLNIKIWLNQGRLYMTKGPWAMSHEMNKGGIPLNSPQSPGNRHHQTWSKKRMLIWLIYTTHKHSRFSIKKIQNNWNNT